MNKIVIFNDCFSANVGDGLIAGCLEHGIRSLAPELEVRTVDLGGRDGYAREGRGISQAARGAIRKAWSVAPAAAHHALARFRVRTDFNSHARAALEGANAVVIGGGQLITGSSTFFARRLAVIAEGARMSGLPLFVHSVGVSNPRHWEDEARHLLRSAFVAHAPSAGVTTRDEASAGYWNTAFGGARPRIARDPGLLAAHAYAGRDGAATDDRTPSALAGPLDRRGETRSATGKSVGIGVIAPAVVRFLASSEGGTMAPSLGLFADIGNAVAACGHRPVYFTNGSGEDEVFLAELRVFLRTRVPELHRVAAFAPQPRSPEALVACVRDMDALIAHRLHANILAYSLGIPHLGLGWDEKLASFFASVDRADALIRPDDGAADLPRRIATLLALAPDPATHARVIGEAWGGIGDLLGRIDQALARSPVPRRVAG